MRVIFALLLLYFSSDVNANRYLFVSAQFPLIAELKSENPDGTAKKAEGLGIDVLQLIAKRLGHEITIEFYPLARAVYMIKNNMADGIIGPYKSKEREAFMNFSQAWFYQDHLLFYVRKYEDFNWHGNYSNIINSKKLVGSTLGWSYRDEFDKQSSALNIVNVNSVEAGFQMLEKKRIDLFVCHPRAAYYELERLKLQERFNTLPDIIKVNKGYFGFPINAKNQKLIQSFNKELNKMVKSGELKQLSAKYKLSLTDL